MPRLFLLWVLLALSLAACQPVRPVTTAAQAGTTEPSPGPTEVSNPPAAAAQPTDDAKIATAMSAAPMAVSHDAAVLDWPTEAGGKPQQLRAGTNDWVCRPDDPATPGNDPRCLDATWRKLFGMPSGPDREAITVPGVAYMLQGDSVADNDDPNAKTPPAGKEWLNNPPHVMVISSIPWDEAVYSNHHDAGGPWLMFKGTPAEHLMVPVETTEKVAAVATDDDKIASAMSAAPKMIAMGAAVVDWPAAPGAKPKELRAGSNGWVCRPDDPGTPGNDPRCLDANWRKLFGTPFGPDRAATAPGIAYMLQGDSVADNDNPDATTPPAGKEWHNNPPHVMIISSQPLDPALFSNDPHSGGPFIMFGGTPKEHLMVPVQEGSH